VCTKLAVHRDDVKVVVVAGNDDLKFSRSSDDTHYHDGTWVLGG